MTDTAPNLTVGQKLWFVPHQRGHGQPREVEVAKLGTKWATLSDGWHLRIDKRTLWADGGDHTSPGRCYLSRKVYEAEANRQHVWSEFVRAMRDNYHVPKDVTVEDIQQAARLVLHREIVEVS